MTMNHLPQKTIDALVKFNNSGPFGRYAAALAMQMPDGEIKIVERKAEPCYGFLRKYQSTHKDATEPEYKPGDLHNPFPEGTPLAIAFPFSHDLNTHGTLIDYVTGSESPWITGFNAPENLIRTYNKNNKWTGFILVDTDVDPTVMINLMKLIKTADSRIGKFNTMLAEGLTPFEALCTVTLNRSHSYAGDQSADTYMFATVVDLKKMKEGKVNKFSKGTFKERADYSRKNIQDIFKDEKGIKLGEEVSKMAAELKISLKPEAGKPYGDPKPYAKVVKEVFKKYL